MKRRTFIQSCMAAVGLGAVMAKAKADAKVKIINVTEDDRAMIYAYPTKWMAFGEIPSLPPGEYHLAIDRQNTRYKVLGRKGNSA